MMEAEGTTFCRGGAESSLHGQMSGQVPEN